VGFSPPQGFVPALIFELTQVGLVSRQFTFLCLYVGWVLAQHCFQRIYRWEVNRTLQVIKDKPRTFKKKDIFFFSEAISRRKGKITKVLFDDYNQQPLQ